jgi:hypothetical protein
MQLVLVTSEVVQLGKRICHLLPSAAANGAKGGHNVAQAVLSQHFEAVNAEAPQGPLPVNLAEPSAGAVDADRLEQVLPQLAGNGPGRFTVAVGRFPVLQAQADCLVLAAD